MNAFPHSEAICRITAPHQWDEAKSQLMVNACREMAEFHVKHSPDIAFLYEKNGFVPSSLQSEGDLERLPFIGVTAMKYFLLTSLPHDKAVLKLTSSGTRGQKTQIWFDEESLARVQAQMDGMWQEEGLVSHQPTNYCNFIYDPTDAQDLGIAFSVKNEERFAPAKESFFVVRKNELGAWYFDKDKAIAKLQQYAADSCSTRLLGIPSFLFELLLVLEERNLSIPLPKGSYLLTGGGWKAAEDKSVTRAEFRKMVTKYLGITDENIRDGFGMAEHSAPYIECDHHHFHVPAYNRILVRDPETLAVLPAGQTGLLEFITPFNAMMPNLAILSTDLGFLDVAPCTCGRKSPTFTLVGRGGIKKHKGCAISATDLVKRN